MRKKQKKKKERKVLCSLNMAQNRQNLHEFNLETFSLKANPHRPLSLAEKDLPCPRKIYLQRVEFQAENILIRAADLGKLNEGVLDAASEGHGLTQQRGIIPEFILQQDTESGKTLMVFPHFVPQAAKTHQTGTGARKHLVLRAKKAEVKGSQELLCN